MNNAEVAQLAETLTNKLPFEEIRWTPNLAYAVGLIATDGNLSIDGRHVELTSKDLEQLNTFKRCLNLKNRIGLKTSGYSKKLYPRIQFGNRKFYRWLLDIGLTTSKSKSLGPLNIPDAYFFDFLRGCLDGDGCIRSFPDSIYPKAQRLYISFYSASCPFLEWIQQRTKSLIEITGSIRRMPRTFELRYLKKTSVLLLRAIYYHPEVPHLKRKRQIADPFLDTEIFPKPRW